MHTEKNHNIKGKSDYFLRKKYSVIINGRGVEVEIRQFRQKSDTFWLENNCGISTDNF